MEGWKNTTQPIYKPSDSVELKSTKLHLRSLSRMLQNNSSDPVSNSPPNVPTTLKLLAQPELPGTNTWVEHELENVDSIRNSSRQASNSIDLYIQKVSQYSRRRPGERRENHEENQNQNPNSVRDLDRDPDQDPDPEEFARFKRDQFVTQKFLLSPAKMGFEIILDKIYSHPGENLGINIKIENRSQRSVRKMQFSALKLTDFHLGKRGIQSVVWGKKDWKETHPIRSGRKFSKMYWFSTVFGEHGTGSMPVTWTISEGTGEGQGQQGNDLSSMGMLVRFVFKVKLVLGPFKGRLSEFIPYFMANALPVELGEGDREKKQEMEMEIPRRSPEPSFWDKLKKLRIPCGGRRKTRDDQERADELARECFKLRFAEWVENELKDEELDDVNVVFEGITGQRKKWAVSKQKKGEK